MLYTRSLRRAGQFMNRMSLPVKSGIRKSSSGLSVRGQIKRSYPRVEETKWLHDADKAQILANYFETVFTHGSSLPETVPQSRTGVAKIGYVQMTCGDVERIFKSLKKDKSPGPYGILPILLNELAEEISYPLTKIFQASLESGLLPNSRCIANVKTSGRWA